jgi:hypothetical protein
MRPSSSSGRWLRAAALATTVATSSLASFLVLDPSNFAAYLPNAGDLEWAESTLPFFEMDDTDLTQAYYYRASVFRMHINATRHAPSWASPNAYIITEFLADVPWAGAFNSIPDAAGHHIHEGRWLRDPTPVADDVAFWLNSSLAAPEVYTTWWSHSVLAWAQATGDASRAASYLPNLIRSWLQWNTSHYIEEDDCYYQIDDRDAMEDSISGNGCRPTVTSAHYANAVAIAELAEWAGNATAAATFRAEASRIQKRALQLLWNESLAAFVVYKPVGSPGAAAASLSLSAAAAAEGGGDGRGTTRPTATRGSWRRRQLSSSAPPAASTTLTCPPPWPAGEQVTVRELLGLATPWYFRLVPQDPESVATYGQAWAQLLDPEGFWARWGPRTAERRAPCYNFSFAHECLWNAPTWPYETSRLLSGLANLLIDYPPPPAAPGGGSQLPVRPADLVALMRQYARLHTQSSAINGTRPWIGEDLHPDEGYWLARDIMYRENQTLRNRGDHYNHSTFIDLVISALLGLRAALGSVFTLHPLVAPADPASPAGTPPGSSAWFALDNLLLHGRNVTILWDADGSRYGRGPGLQVWCEGTRIASAPTLGGGNLTVDLGLCPG